MLLIILAMLPFSYAVVYTSCYSPIYCEGSILHMVQTAKIFNDSKTFVDMSLVHSINVTMERFLTMLQRNNQNPSEDAVHDFVSENFRTVGELEEHSLDDYKIEPPIVKEIEDPSVRYFTKNLISIWPLLGRVMSSDVLTNPNKYSLIPVNYTFIIPGGRFKEFYYWDSFWIVRGLLISDMTETARGMILNLLSMVERYGFIPNGGRIYYLNRTQPPLLTLMVADYFAFTSDFIFLREHLPTVEKELKFWLENRLVEIEINNTAYYMAHYSSRSNTPRPESYLEDIETCAMFPNMDDKQDCYQDLKSGAESGWDFTSRWIFDKCGGNNANLSHIQTRRVVPVDLNSFLYKCFMKIKGFCDVLEETDKAKFWGRKADMWRENIEKFLYNNTDGIWYDYDIKLNKHRAEFYPSNFAPLWADAVPSDKKQEYGKRAVDYLHKNDILSFRGGIPASFLHSGEQWDFPNAWSPLQGIVIFALEKSQHPEAIEMAKTLAKIWVRSNLRAFTENKVMFEKYNAEIIGQFGGGGEYHIQSGFGWSNGLILELIHYYYRTRTRKFVLLE